MLYLTVRTHDSVLLYNAHTRKLLGTVTYSENAASASLGFDMTRDIIVLRESVVRRVTDDISVCPKQLAEKFGSKD